MNRIFRSKGFALITTIAAITLALLMLSAFLRSNQSFLNLSRMDEDRQVCRATVLSLSEFCHQQLEDNKAWGFSNWEGRDEVRLSPSRVMYEYRYIPPGDDFEGHGLEGYRHLVGSSPETGVEFHVAFSNNLNSDSGVSDGETDPFDTDGGLDHVPAKSCLLRISARRGGHTEAAEITLRRAALFDSVLAASGDVTITLNDRAGAARGSDRLAIFDSADPVRNAIRSESGVYLPPRDRLSFRPSGHDTPIQGTVWAKDKIYVNGDNSPEILGDTARQHHVELLENARDNYNVPELTADDFDHTEQEELELTPSVYHFAEKWLTYEVEYQGNTYLKERPLRVLARYEPQSDGSPGNLTEFHYHERNLTHPITVNGVSVDPSQVTVKPETVKFDPARYSDPGMESVAGTGHASHRFRVDFRDDGLKSGAAPIGNIAVDLRDREDTGGGGTLADGTEPKMVLPSNYQLRVKDGAFKLVAPTDRLVPKISFGPLSGWSEAEEVASNRGHLSVDGDIVLEGRLEKGGKIISREGNVVIMPHEAEVESNSDFELAVFAKHNVSIVPPKNWESRTEDGDAGHPLVFRGLIYAGDNFRFDSVRRDEYGQVIQNSLGQGVFFNRKLFVEGAVIANRGKIDIHSRRGVHFIYNPDFLDDYIEREFLDRNMHIEEIAWRPLSI